VSRKKEKINIVSNTRFYTGVGSRSTPNSILDVIEKIAEKLYNLEWTLRSGGCKEGPDAEFERVYENRFTTISDLARRKFVHKELYEIYYPNRSFKNSFGAYSIDPDIWEEAKTLAEKFHPNWQACSQKARDLHTRNSFQILGRDLQTPSKFVVCYTPKGAVVGRTGQTLRLALHHEIPIFNLGTNEGLQSLVVFLEKECQ
jgi:hypothetical protein